MLYAAILHLLAGVATGAIFKVRTLLILLVLVLLEAPFLMLTHGSIALLWTVANLIGVQTGYMSGLIARGALEHAGYPRAIRPRRLP